MTVTLWSKKITDTWIFHCFRSGELSLDKSSLCVLETCLSKDPVGDYDGCIRHCLGPPDDNNPPSANKRQIDPLQSCIEAKCAGVWGYKYGDCVFSRCIMGMGLSTSMARRKKSWNDVMKTCVDFHCTDMVPGSMDYTVCVHSNCGRIAYGKRWRHKYPYERNASAVVCGFLCNSGLVARCLLTLCSTCCVLYGILATGVSGLLCSQCGANGIIKPNFLL